MASHEKFDPFVKRHPHPHQWFFDRPHLSRRRFFQIMGSGVGEFGRTIGPVTAAGGRDHFLQQSVVFGSAGIRGGRTLGSTTPDGSSVVDPGWSRGRPVKPEDVEATIYSALGINWTTVRYDDPFHRGFEYVPFSDQDVYGPINELWG